MPGLLDLATVVRSFGRGVMFRAALWDFASDLWSAMVHSLDTEGDIVVNFNSEVVALTLPELSGPAAHEYDYTGENPTLEVPGYLTDPANVALFGPSGVASAGRSRRSAPVYHTICILPEGVLLRDPDPTTRIVEDGVLSHDGTNFLLDGQPVGAARQEMIDAKAIWLWKCVANRSSRSFRGGAGDARKDIETVSILTAHHPDAPEGHHLYTIGDPAGAGIDVSSGIIS